MKLPHPGDLSHKIEIGKTVTVTNENGFPTQTDVTLFYVWSGIEDASSRWYFAADATNAENALYFVIRYILTVQSGMWVKWNGQKYVITEVNQYDYHNRYMRLKTQRTEGVA